ncbi:hypothetical protein [Xanthomonas phage DES1]|nr:hypothetical protein [Xanthomonas phage DES1]
MKHAIQKIYDVFPDAPERHLYLTGKGNFRDELATIKEYKGNRDVKAKPFYYKEIREYMEHFQGAEVIHGQEADDAIGIKQWANPDKSTVICSIDKDLRNIPGHHFNPVKDILDYVTLPQANYNFWKQVLVGDRSDNIPGLPKVGDKTADKILATTDKSWNSMYNKVFEEYRKYYGNDGRWMAHEIASLVWIRRQENKNYDGKEY